MMMINFDEDFMKYSTVFNDFTKCLTISEYFKKVY